MKLPLLWGLELGICKLRVLPLLCWIIKDCVHTIKSCLMFRVLELIIYKLHCRLLIFSFSHPMADLFNYPGGVPSVQLMDGLSPYFWVLSFDPCSNFELWNFSQHFLFYYLCLIFTKKLTLYEYFKVFIQCHSQWYWYWTYNTN